MHNTETNCQVLPIGSLIGYTNAVSFSIDCPESEKVKLPKSQTKIINKPRALSLNFSGRIGRKETSGGIIDNNWNRGAYYQNLSK